MTVRSRTGSDVMDAVTNLAGKEQRAARVAECQRRDRRATMRDRRAI